MPGSIEQRSVCVVEWTMSHGNWIRTLGLHFEKEKLHSQTTVLFTFFLLSWPFKNIAESIFKQKVNNY